MILQFTPEKFSDKKSYLDALKSSSADLLVIDLYYNDVPLTKQDLEYIKIKNDGKKRLVYSYMSIGEAENYRYYWKKEWSKNLPKWIVRQNSEWAGDFVVKYWNKDWQNIL
ncbi:hypothetical protein [Pectinatus sottacetonis]|uniref:hypothetical protein n=1 Tax=Pectinatus sottacetonis TaxID=1002795 RepID=UPI001E5A3C89|nr:hypothetical protein [Pectinatus sottacetonis]